MNRINFCKRGDPDVTTAAIECTTIVLSCALKLEMKRQAVVTNFGLTYYRQIEKTCSSLDDVCSSPICLLEVRVSKQVDTINAEAIRATWRDFYLTFVHFNTASMIFR